MAEATTELLTTADGRPLKAALAAAQARAKRRAFLLVLPLLLFVLFTFLIPIGYMLKRSFEHDGFASSAPALVAWFEANPDFDPANPPEEAYAALVQDLARMQTERTTGIAGTRINYSVPGSISLFKKGAREAANLTPPFKESLVALDADWARPALWRGMESASHVYTAEFYKVASDMKLTDSGWARGQDKERIYLYLFAKTFFVSALITVICLLLAFPVAHLLATLPMAKSSLLMILVLLPFWTSLLVRTTSWIALLQEQGVVNNLLVGLGLLSNDGRLTMMYNMTGTIVAMTHVLLPFMILPLYSVMRVIPPSYARAARSLGATSWTTFRRVYLPQTLPGIAAGSLLVFILAVGYYITPALVGGADGQLISNLIAFHMSKSNWSLAAAIAGMLLASILLLYWLYDRLIGIDRLKFG
ncbi:ABC transporter permease [Rhodobacter calidifons]|uniref:ABC transporter permease n=1 Tax=Rhodobacter calidifons TaxID=2715277 RepID=A0ABX0G9X5_9RHOB|nr:ABC transporter permease [Rhodobacter calidifons]NHB77714.1 ABC transporter permease [Rhodobacter calidifons]